VDHAFSEAESRKPQRSLFDDQRYRQAGFVRDISRRNAPFFRPNSSEPKDYFNAFSYG
jgi:hypothetical protein